MSSQFSLFYSEIELSQYHFERNEAEVEILRNITKDELLECYKTFIGRDSRERRVLAVHIVSTQNSPDETGEDEDPKNDDNVNDLLKKHEKIADLAAFKSSKELFPLCSPFLEISAKGARSKL